MQDLGLLSHAGTVIKFFRNSNVWWQNYGSYPRFFVKINLKNGIKTCLRKRKFYQIGAILHSSIFVIS